DAGAFQEMKTACEKNKVIFMEAFMYYFHPQHARVREVIANGEIGEVKYMRAGFTFPIGDNQATNIRMNKEKGGGSIYDIGCYAIPFIRSILQLGSENLQGEASVDPDYAGEVGGVTFKCFPNGVRASFEVSLHQANRAEYEVVGTGGKISVPN